LGFTLQGFAPPGCPRILSNRPSPPDVTQPRLRHASSVRRRIRTSSRFMRPRECPDRPSPRHCSAREAVFLSHRLGFRSETVALLVFSLPRAFPARSQCETVVSQSAYLLFPAPLPFGSGPRLQHSVFPGSVVALSLSRAPSLSRFLPWVGLPLRDRRHAGLFIPLRATPRCRKEGPLLRTPSISARAR